MPTDPGPAAALAAELQRAASDRISDARTAALAAVLDRLHAAAAAGTLDLAVWQQLILDHVGEHRGDLLRAIPDALLVRAFDQARLLALAAAAGRFQAGDQAGLEALARSWLQRPLPAAADPLAASLALTLAHWLAPGEAALARELIARAGVLGPAQVARRREEMDILCAAGDQLATLPADQRAHALRLARGRPVGVGRMLLHLTTLRGLRRLPRRGAALRLVAAGFPPLQRHVAGGLVWLPSEVQVACIVVGVLIALFGTPIMAILAGGPAAIAVLVASGIGAIWGHRLLERPLYGWLLPGLDRHGLFQPWTPLAIVWYAAICLPVALAAGGAQPLPWWWLGLAVPVGLLPVAGVLLVRRLAGTRCGWLLPGSLVGAVPASGQPTRGPGALFVVGLILVAGWLVAGLLGAPLIGLPGGEERLALFLAGLGLSLQLARWLHSWLLDWRMRSLRRWPPLYWSAAILFVPMAGWWWAFLLTPADASAPGPGRMAAIAAAQPLLWMGAFLVFARLTRRAAGAGDAARADVSGAQPGGGPGVRHP